MGEVLDCLAQRPIAGPSVTLGGVAPRLVARQIAGGAGRHRVRATGGNTVAELYQAQRFLRPAQMKSLVGHIQQQIGGEVRGSWMVSLASDA